MVQSFSESKRKLAIKLVADMFRHRCRASSGSKGEGGQHRGRGL